jgi:chromosome segregation ATPase
MSYKLTGENQKLGTELHKLQYQQSHDREELLAYKRKNEANESKISAYNASFIELAEKLKQLNDDTKALRRENNKKEKKCNRLEKGKKKLKATIKDLNEKNENIRIVTKDLVRIKHETKLQSEEWEKERLKYDNNVQQVKAQMMQQARKKIESINKYNVEMNNLRTNIKTLQKRIVANEEENERLRETDSQSVIGSAANWVPSMFWTTKKNKY